MVVTRGYDNLKNRTGFVISCKYHPDLNMYKVDLDLYPSQYQLKQDRLPILFAEEELQFEDSSKERDWKLKQLLK